MKKKVAISFLLLFCVGSSHLFGVTKEKSKLNSYPLSKLLHQEEPKKLARDSSLFSSYIKQDQNFSLHQKKENFRKVPKFPLHLEEDLIFSLASNDAISSSHELNREALGEKVRAFLNGHFVEKILQGHTFSDTYLSSLSEIAAEVDDNLSIEAVKEELAPPIASFTKNNYPTKSSAPITRRKTKLAVKRSPFQSSEVKKAALLNSATSKNSPSYEGFSYSCDLALNIDTKEKTSYSYLPKITESEEELCALHSAIGEKEYLLAGTNPLTSNGSLNCEAINTPLDKKAFSPSSLSIKEKDFSLPSISINREQIIAKELSPHLKKVAISPFGKKSSSTKKHNFFDDNLECSLSLQAILQHKDLLPSYIAKNSPKKEGKVLALSFRRNKERSLKNPSSIHRFPIHLKKTTFESHLAEKARAFFSEEIDFPSSPHLDPFPAKIHPISLLTNHSNQEFTLKQQQHDGKEKVLTTLPRNEKVSTSYRSFPIKQTEKIFNSNIVAVKLPRTQQTEELFQEKVYPTFFRNIPAQLQNETISFFTPKEVFFAKQEHLQKQIALSKIGKSSALTSFKEKRSFDAALADRSFDKEIAKITNPVEGKKGNLEKLIFAKIPEKEFNTKKISTTVSSSLQNKKPMPLDRITLSDKLPIKKVALTQEIALPNAQTKKKAKFSMHPMLSLFKAPTSFIEEEARFVAIETNRGSRMTGYDLFNWPSLEDLNTISLSDNFYLDTRLLDSELSDQIEFACTVRANEKNLIPTLPIQILYILDASSSIEAHRFGLFKKAILDSLDYLDRSATFNIAVVSKGKITKLRERNISPTKSGKSYAKRFLRKVEQSSAPSFEGMISVIAKEKALAKKNNYHRCCVLLSDGNFAKNIRVNSHSLNKLKEEDIGNFSLYTATASDKNNKQMLSLLARLNHGFSLFTRTHASFPRKFSMLVKRIKDPILHDITVTFPDDDFAMAYNEGNIAPILHTGRNLTLFGSIPEKKGGRIFIQGRSGDRWVNVVKEMPLEESRKGKYGLHKKLATQKTLFAIRSFLDTGDETHLTDAKKYSEEYDLHTLVE
ncbi:hypothetical protein K0U07_00245 [bacterium]|nr:hypothetical protein [bacterium]